MYEYEDLLPASPLRHSILYILRQRVHEFYRRSMDLILPYLVCATRSLKPAPGLQVPVVVDNCGQQLARRNK